MTTKKRPDIAWEISVPLINNPFIFKTSIQLCLITWFVIVSLFVIIFTATGEFDALPPLLTIMTAVCAGLWVLMLLVMLLFYGNRMSMRFTIDSEGVTCDIMSRRSKWVNRLLIVFGMLARKPGAVGTGMIAMSQESQTVEWERIHELVHSEKRKCITLRNRWRSLLMIFCLPENYGAVLETIQANLPRRTEEQKQPQKIVRRLLTRTVLTVLACLPMFGLEYPFKIDLFLPIFILCFAEATIWLIPFFGYVVIAAVLYLMGVIIFQGLQVHSSQFRFMEDYRGFELLMGDEWIFMGLLFAALLYLIWSSWRSVKGKDKSALFVD